MTVASETSAKFRDEILFQAIIAGSEQVNGYARNVQYSARKGLLGDIADSLEELSLSMKRLSDLVKEAKERANANE